MLTRLKVNGFKNLDGIDVCLGPFTCVAGPNGVGKSNLFDAIAFLAALADRPLIEAASIVRGGDSRRGEVWSIFQRAGDRVAEKMTFSAEFLIPEKGEDELGQTARASMTLLQYELELRYRHDSTIKTMGALEIVREKLVHINRSQAKKRLGFPHKTPWRDSVVKGRRTSPYISTEIEHEEAVVSLHADSVGGMGGGRPRRVPAASLRRCCMNPHWPARCQPTGFSPADAIRHWSAEGGHLIEDFAAEDHLTPLPGWAPGAKAISDDGFVSEERILHPALTMVP